MTHLNKYLVNRFWWILDMLFPTPKSTKNYLNLTCRNFFEVELHFVTNLPDYTYMQFLYVYIPPSLSVCVAALIDCI